jgi:hypothetical protein
VAFPYTAAYGDGTPYVSLGLGSTPVPVANQSELDAKIAAIQPGQKLVLGAGAYGALTIQGKNGTAALPISIVAQSTGSVAFTGAALIKDCSYLTINGLTWPQDMAGDTVQFRGASHHCRLIRNTIGPSAHPGVAITTEPGNYVFVGDDCHTLDIGYNELRNKARSGNGVRVYGNFTTYVGCKRVRIHHNYIHDFYPAVVNDFEPIRYGVSTMSRTDSYGVIERNRIAFVRSEPELISGKMGQLRITGNVAYQCSGSMVIRHGRNCILADNYAIDGTAGARTYFGTLVTLRNQVGQERAGGAMLSMIEPAWDQWETADGTFSATYAADVTDWVTKLRAAGQRITLATGLHYSPSYLANLANGRYVNQSGSTSSVPNLIFNQTIRARAERYLDQMHAKIDFSQLWAIRLTAGSDAEVLFPDGGYWAYDANAQNGTGRPPTMPLCPFPGWKPGQTSLTTDQVRTWLEWYISCLCNVLSWQMAYFRSKGFRGWFEILTPGSGVRPSGWESEIAARLSPVNNLLGRGAAWDQVYRLMPDRSNCVVYVSSIADGSGGDDVYVPGTDDDLSLTSTTWDSRSALRWQTRIARQYGMPVGGENPGYPGDSTFNAHYADTSSAGLLAKSFAQITGSQCDRFYWAHSERLWPPLNTLPFSNYSAKILAKHADAASVVPPPSSEGGGPTWNTNGEGSGGFRFYDSGHLVERNYGYGLVGSNFQDPLVLDSGDVDSTSSSLSSHFQVVGATVVGNVIANSLNAITIGNNYSLAPLSCTIKGNVGINCTSGVAINQRIAPINSTVDGTNQYYTSAASGGFTADTDGILRKSGYGPRLTYLKATDVGPTADPGESDGTGAVLVGASPTPGTTTTTGGTTGTNTGSTGGTTTGTTGTTGTVRTLGVGGIPRPAAGTGVHLATASTTNSLSISTSGTASQYEIWDGGGFDIGRITINANYVIVQNYKVNADGQYGIYATGHHIILANNDIRNIHAPGDLNAFTIFGDYNHVIYNTFINGVTGDPGTSHTDAIQTWDTSSKRPSNNIVVQGNRFTGPMNPGMNSSIPSIHQCIMAEGPASTDGGGGGPGPMANWIVADNYFAGSWNQEVKFDDVDNVEVTRNTFAGQSTKICEVTSLSSGFKYYSDNKVTGSYGSIGVSVTAGAGPMGPYPPGTVTGNTGGTTDPGTTPTPGSFTVNAGPDVSAPAGSPVLLSATEANTTALTVTSRKWEVMGTPTSGGGTVDTSTAAGKFGWGNPLSSSDEFNYSGVPDTTKWYPDTGGMWDATQGSVAGSTMTLAGISTGKTYSMEHRYGQQYGRWECRLRHKPGLLSVTYRYYKFAPIALRDPSVANSVQLSEFALLNGTTRQTGGTYTATNNSSNVGEDPTMAGDNNTATKWNSLNKTASTLVVDFGSPRQVTGYRWATANDATERDPVSWSIQGSNDNATWTTIDQQSNVAVTTNRQTYLADFGLGATTGGTGGGGQSLGVGGVATPPGAIVATSNTGAFTFSSGGTASNPKVYDGAGKDIGEISITASNVIIQNYRVNANSNYGCTIQNGTTNVTVQNCDFRNIHGPGDINIFTVFGSNWTIQFNTVINAVSNPGGSHTDFIQTWVSSSHPNASSNNRVIGNKVIGPDNPSRDNNVPSIHQLIMVESAGHGGNSGGSGTPTNWYIADNEWGASWGQDIKLDCGNQFVFTRNKFVGSSDHAFAFVCGSGNVVWSDNTFSSKYGSIGASITNGSGPGTPPSGTTGVTGGNYNPIVSIQPDSGSNVENGAYYIMTNTAPGEQTERAQMYFPRNLGTTLLREFTKASVDWTQFHNLALEWTSTALTGYVDGVQFFTTGGGATTQNRDIQSMPSGHLSIALNNPTSSTTMNPGTMEIDWARVYSLVPQGTVTGSTGTVSTAQSFSWTTPLTIGSYTLRYTVTLSDATTRSDDVVVTVITPQPGYMFPPGIASEEDFGTTTSFYVGTTLPDTLTYPGSTTFPGTTTYPGQSDVVTPPPVALPGSFVPPGIASEETWGSTNNFFTGIPPLFLVGHGNILSEEAFGATTAFTTGTEPTPASGGVFVPSLWAVDKLTGAMIPLPRWSKITVSRQRHNLGTVTVEYPADAVGFSTLYASVQANPPKALEFRLWLGGNSTGSLGGWFVAKSSGNKAVPGAVWTFTGHFQEWLMTKAVIAPQDKTSLNPKGEMVFGGATAGAVLLTVVQQAQARGALPYVACDFTSSKDSNGNPWTDVVTNLKFSPKTTLMQVADKLVDLMMAEYYMTGSRILRAFNFGQRGTDRSVTNPPLVFAQTINLREFTQRESARDAGTSVLAAGSEGFYSWASNVTAQASLGFRAEVGADAGNVASQSGVDAYATLQADAVAKGVAEYTSGIEFRQGDDLPLLDYDVSDIGVAVTGTERIPSRIEQIDITFEPGKAPNGTIAQNNLVVDKLTALYRRMNAITAGDAVVGTSTSTPGGAGDDHNPPAAPTGLVVSSNVAYQAPGQTITLAEVTVGWLPVTTNAYVDDATARKAHAATVYVDRLKGQALGSEWTYRANPIDDAEAQVPALQTEWKADTVDNPSGSTLVTLELISWLSGYAARVAGGGAATDDVAGYRVQYAYLETVAVGGVRTGTLSDTELFWRSAPGSPTGETVLSFGDVEAGRAVGVRVSAYDNAGNEGPFSARLDFTAQEDNTPPPVPSTPLASAWFRTMNITWDGKGSQGEDEIAAAPDFLSGGGLEIHVGQGFNFEPHRPVLPNGQLDLANSITYVATLYGPGTWNYAGPLSYGVTYYARFVAVDRVGNASQPSATSNGVTPEQLVQIEIGPGAIGREQIIDLEVVRAKIADGAVNSLKVEEISAGLISAGTMKAQVALAGRFYTPTTANGNHVEFDADGIRLYRGATVVGRWQVADASVLVTGTYQSGLSGRRINILPSGTMFFYPNAGSNYGFLENSNGDLRLSGQVNTSNYAGYVVIDETRAALTFGLSDFTPRTRFQTDPLACASWAPIISQRVDRRFGDPDGLGARWLFTNFDNSGDIGTSIVHLQQVSAASNHAVMYGANSDAGIVFDAGFIGVVHNNISLAEIHASNVTFTSDSRAKTDVRSAALPGGMLGTVNAAESKQWKYKSDTDPRPSKPGGKIQRRREHDDGTPVVDEFGKEIYDDVDAEWSAPQAPAPWRFGPMAEDLPLELQRRHPRTGELMLGAVDLIGVLWGAVRELSARVDQLDPKRKPDTPPGG